MRYCCKLNLLMLLLLALLGACTPTRPAADLTITGRGCATTSFLLPAEHEPTITVENQAAERMVFTIPTMNRWVVLGQGERADFELPRYIMGSFDFFCLSEADHTTLSGGNPFLCALEPAQLAPVARSAGTFKIAQHNRIQEVLQPTMPPAP